MNPSGIPRRRADAGATYFLFSPASSYPQPYARLIDADGSVVHTWSNAEEQPAVGDNPPSFLRGWNHVEVDDDGSLFAIVPLQSLLKLDRNSNLVWKANVAAHHDLEIAGNGDIYVLTESPRRLQLDGRVHVILDNEITMLSSSGAIRRTISMYDILHTDPDLAARIDRNILLRHDLFARNGWPGDSGTELDDKTLLETRALLETGDYSGEKRRALQLLRKLPESPCDVLHTNTVEILDTHPSGLWHKGQVLTSLRNLDLIVVLDLENHSVVWRWGDGELSGQHQPSALPNGNILVFDNGASVGRSRIVEMNPVAERIEWEYLADPPESFFSPVAAGCELLPSGNILVTDAQSGRAFQLSRDQRVVWDWTMPANASATTARRTSIYRMSAVSPSRARRILED